MKAKNSGCPSVLSRTVRSVMRLMCSMFKPRPIFMDVVDQSKSPNDKKKYRLLTLENELQVLLISTTDVAHHGSGDDNDHGVFDSDEGEHGTPSRRSGACLTVGVGSFAEPMELPGLAHYLEHMLFMGSEKYPDENEFEAFLSAHGGFSNGSTDNEVTNYMFEVGPAHLEHALDMFAHFFISPLMKAEALERELSAIDSEFIQATQNDRIRLQQVLSDTSVPSHPYHRFGWGNRKSLMEDPARRNINVREEILKFYTQNYSANIMKLVVCGDNSLDEMEKWVRASFTQIPNKHLSPRSYADAGNPFGANVDPSPILCRIVPIRDIHTLHLNWMIPPIFGLHHQKPADYVASLLGHESEGSVLSLLKKKGWISSLTAGVTGSDGYDCGTFGAKFDVSMKLTVEGIAHWREIVLAVFEYLRMLRESGLPEWVFEELKALGEISFRFQEEGAAIENCEELAQTMQSIFQVAPQDLLRFDLFQGEFQRDLVKQLLEHLTPGSLRVCLVSQKHQQDEDFVKQAITEEWFDVKYTKETIDQATVSQWVAATQNAALHLPKPNPFIPRNFSLADANTPDMSCHSSTFGNLWYRPDRIFATPRAHLAFQIHLPSIMASANNFVRTELFVKLVRDALNEYAYHASVAELMYSLRVKDCGLELLFGGFNDKLGLLVDVVVRAVFSNELSASRFDAIKEEMLREYKNSIVKPSHKSKYLRLQLLERVSYSLPDCVQALEGETIESLHSFVSSTLWASKAFVSSFAHGNITADQACAMRQLVEDGLQRVSAPLAAADLPPRHIHVLPSVPAGLLVEAPVEHEDDKNTFVEFYYQIGAHNQRWLAYADLLHQLMEEPLFDTLRTKQELGYDVSCTVRITHGVLGFGVMVQSSQFAAEHIATCVDRFMIDFEAAIGALSDQHFADHVAAQIQKKLEPDHNLLEATHRIWYEIASGRMEFDIDEKLAEEFKTCTKHEMIEFYRSWILANPKKLVVMVRGKCDAKADDFSAGSKNEVAPTVVDDIYAYKTTLSVYEDHLRRGHTVVDPRFMVTHGEQTSL
ncbi:TPA: hypothetical protein N0F65_004318 [Lagenidium giganteum]|uniref:Nardilysin n=1 Tax=Lagenidium giganteum TaxID=4803 RepID=A0AAV2ZE10_9STRA|nr:TPA: hypothetical protein N0F65_004318 [Lagenidium giganteum]